MHIRPAKYEIHSRTGLFEPWKRTILQLETRRKTQKHCVELRKQYPYLEFKRVEVIPLTIEIPLTLILRKQIRNILANKQLFLKNFQMNYALRN